MKNRAISGKPWTLQYTELNPMDNERLFSNTIALQLLSYIYRTHFILQALENALWLENESCDLKIEK